MLYMKLFVDFSGLIHLFKYKCFEIHFIKLVNNHLDDVQLTKNQVVFSHVVLLLEFMGRLNEIVFLFCLFVFIVGF